MNYEETPNYRLIGKRIRELREKFGMTQENLAEAIEVSVPYVSHIERGMKRPSLQILVRIAVAFEITVDTLLIGSQPTDKEVVCAEVQKLLDDCSPKERRMLLAATTAIKNVLRDGT